MTTLIADIEANGLLDTVDTLWQLSVIDDETGRLSSFNRDTLPAGLTYLKTADKIVFHNGLGYDLLAIQKTTGITLDSSKIIDTLVLSRLARPDREGGHSLGNWGLILGHPKVEHEDWSVWTPAMQTRCDEDVLILRKVYHKLRPMLTKYPHACEIEHRVAWETAKMSARGIELDVGMARNLASELREEQEHVLRDVRQAFPPILVPKEASASKRVRSLKNVNKSHPLYGQLDPGVEYCPVKVQQFNPASRTQVAARFKQKYGWKPTTFTPGGAPEISEETLGDLDYPEAEVFAKYLKVEKLLGYIDGAPKKSGAGGGWLHHERGSVIYPGLNPLGTITGRPSCASPNLQQVPTDKRARACFRAREGRVLVGVDASGLELRMLGHYLSRYDGGTFAREVVEGDVHSRIRDAIDFGPDDVGRGFTKNIEYGMIYGAANPRLASIARKCYRAQGREVTWRSDRSYGGQIRQKVKEQIKGYDALEAKVKAKAKSQKWIKGIDGRRIWIKSDHSALNFLLQSAGIIVIKQAMVLAPDLLRAAGLEEDADYWPILWVHDEWQVEVLPEKAEQVGQVLASSFAEAGKLLGIKCRLDGEYKIGSTWAETH